MNYSVAMMDIATEHPVDFIIDHLPFMRRKHNSEECYIIIILCFATPVEILTKDGLTRGEPGDCMIVAYNFPEYHRTWPGDQKGFVNDWIHVNVKQCSKLEELEPPFNTLIHTRNPMFLRPYLETIKKELINRETHYDLMVSNCIEQAIINMTRVHDSRDDNNQDSEYKTRLMALQQQVRDSINEQWTVDRMAREAGLSISRFSTIYKKQFQTSPMEDVIGMRLTEAKRLLMYTGASMKEIAVLCGFQNEFYFSRCFKKREGITPSTYRGK